VLCSITVINECSIQSEIRRMVYLFCTIVLLKFLDDVTASPSRFRLALARTMQSTSLISEQMER